MSVTLLQLKCELIYMQVYKHLNYIKTDLCLNFSRLLFHNYCLGSSVPFCLYISWMPPAYLSFPPLPGQCQPPCLDSLGSGKKQDEMPTRVSVTHDSATRHSCQKGQDDPGPRNRSRHNRSMRSSSPYIWLCPDTLDILPQGVSGNVGRIQSRAPHTILEKSWAEIPFT